jgi:hypothetical protein
VLYREFKSAGPIMSYCMATWIVWEVEFSLRVEYQEGASQVAIEERLLQKEQRAKCKVRTSLQKSKRQRWLEEENGQAEKGKQTWLCKSGPGAWILFLFNKTLPGVF